MGNIYHLVTNLGEMIKIVSVQRVQSRGVVRSFAKQNVEVLIEVNVKLVRWQDTLDDSACVEG